MKTIIYTGSSKLISRIVHLLNRKAPLPLDGDGDAVWGTNGQVLTTDGQGNTSWTTPQGGGGDVTDVEVNGTSVVNAQGVAEVSVPTKTSDLNNDSGFIDGTDLSTALSDYTPTSSLATVATSGSYNDLSNKPTIPSAQVQSDWSQADNTQVDYIKNKPSIPTALSDLSDDSTHRVVTDTQISTWNGKSDFSGSYNDLTDKPTIPTVNDGTLTIQQNGTTLGTFTANQSGNTTVNLTGGGGSAYTEGDGIDISAQDVISVDTTFTDASTRTNIASGDTFATILGKIKKFFTDLKTVAFTGAYSDLSGTPNLATVATSGSYSDLSNKPTIPSAVAVKGNSESTYRTGNVNLTSANIGAVDKTGDTMSGNLTVPAIHVDGGRVYGSGDDEGIVITPNTNGYAGLMLGSHNARRSAFYLNNTSVWWRYNNGTTSYDIQHPGKAGTIALTSDIPTTLYRYDCATGSVNAVIVTHTAFTGRNQMFAYGNGNGTPWMMAICAGVDYVNCVVMRNISCGVRYIDTTHFAIITGAWDQVRLCSELSNLSIASASANQTIDTDSTKYPLASNAATADSASEAILAHAALSADEADSAAYLKAPNAAGYDTDQYGSFKHKRSNAYDFFEIASSGGASNFGVYFDSGNFFTKGRGYFYYGSSRSQIWTNVNGTLSLESASNWINLHCNSQVQCRNANDNGWVAIAATQLIPQSNSTRKSKENIKPITEEEAKKLLDVEVISFDYKPNRGFGDGDERKGKFGVIAEDIYKVIPSVVALDLKDGTPSGVSYEKFVPHLIKMVQMQQSEIDTLKAEIAELKGAIK